MLKRTIIHSALVKDGLVIKLDDQASAEEVRKAVLAALPPELRTEDLEIFDEADDDAETRQFADNEDLRRGQALHVGRCRQVETVIRYAGRVLQHRFVPATRIGRVRRWAVHRLHISAADANELVLQVAGTSVQPGRDQHVGSYVDAGSCAVTFDLVRSYTINGDAALLQGQRALESHLEMAPYLLGEVNGRWKFRRIDWPFALFEVFARDGRPYTIRLECDDYPGMPTGAFWDAQRNCWLAPNRWPRAGARFGAALRSDWQGGTALYIPCDRRSIAGHEQWLQLHPAWAWDPSVGVARYLEVVWTMLNGDDYAAPAD